MNGVIVDMAGVSLDRNEFKHPTEYNDDQALIGKLIVEYLNSHMGIYTKKELGGVVKFCFDYFGVELDYGWDDIPGWFCVTEDMIIDRMAKEQAERDAERAEALTGNID